MSAQISAYISDETKHRFEVYSEEHGVKKGFLIENALMYYLSALEEIPAQFFDPKKIELTNASFLNIMDTEENIPTDALKKLMSND